MKVKILVWNNIKGTKLPLETISTRSPQLRCLKFSRANALVMQKGQKPINPRLFESSFGWKINSGLKRSFNSKYRIDRLIGSPLMTGQ